MRILRKWLRRWLGIEECEDRIETLIQQILDLSPPHPDEAHILDEVRRLRWEKRRDTTFRTARRQFLQRRGDI